MNFGDFNNFLIKANSKNHWRNLKSKSMEKTIMILVMVALVFGYFISMYDKINNIEIFKPKYKIEKQKSKGYDLYNYKVYKNTFIFWSYKFFACGKDGYEDALKWINDDKENKSSEVVYNE